MGPPQRQRYNAKSRQSVAGGSSHKRRKHSTTTSRLAQEGEASPFASTSTLPDSNREVIVPGSAEEEAWKQRESRRRELLAASNTEDPDQKLSAKKRKRLDAYIASRLKKEARGQLLEELAKSSAEVRDGRMDFASARTLGTGRLATAREMVEGRPNAKAKFAHLHDMGNSDSEGESEESELGMPEAVDFAPQGEVLEDATRRQRITEAAALFAPTEAKTSDVTTDPPPKASVALPPHSSSSLALGSALARGPDGQPLSTLSRRRRRKGLSQREQRKLRRGAANLNADETSEDSSDSDSSVSSRSEPSASSTGGKPLPPHEHATRSVSGSKSEPDVESEGAETDSEEEAIFMEAMRLRGLPMPSEEEEDSECEDGRDYHSANDSTLSEQVPFSESGRSPTWDGFQSEEDLPEEENPQSGSGSEEIEQSTAEDRLLSDDSDSVKPSRSKGFKGWARSALEMVSSSNDVLTARTEEGAPLEPVAGLSVKVADMGDKDGIIRGPLGERAKSPTSAFAAKHYSEVASSHAIRNVPVQRTTGVVEARMRLPVVQEEDRIVRTILENDVTVISGETGSGKTTQVAQMLFERGFGTAGSDNPGMIGITQPRRVAAMSTADRVAKELNLPANRVSYQIRYDGTVSPQTSLKFMTDGVLLREVASDLLLRKYSVVVIDEAHERSVNTDVLIGMLSRVVRLRTARWLRGEAGSTPLRLIIMSATLRVADFVDNTTLFPSPPPLIRIDARQHPVAVHFNRKTPNDYQEEAVNKACKIHTRLPPGGVLIFLTGEQEIKNVCKQLESRFGRSAVESKLHRRPHHRRQAGNDDTEESSALRVTVRPGREDIEAEDVTLGATDEDERPHDNDIPQNSSFAALEDHEALDTDSEEEKGDGEDLEWDSSITQQPDIDATSPMHILPLYSLLPSSKQLEVFNPPPDGSRLVVVATNVAETSLTIPNIRYVIDCGRAKERKYDTQTGISSFRVDWISKASAAQRAGRAGRTGPGHCYRLYSSNVFEEYFDEFAQAEIRRTPVEGLVLQMKSMNIDNVVNFPFPTPPDRMEIAKAERILTRLGALESVLDEKAHKSVTRISPLGRTMSLFPLSPRFAKLLVQGQQHGCLPFVIALVAAMSVGDLFVREESDPRDTDTNDDMESQFEADTFNSEAERLRQERKERRRKRYEALDKFDSLGGKGVSDAFRSLAVVGAFAYSNCSASFCTENFLRPKAMQEVQQLRNQLSTLVLSTLDPSEASTQITASLASPKLAPPSELQLKVIRQLIACAYIDQVAVRADKVPAAARAIPSLAEQASQGQLKSSWRSCRHVPYLAMGVPGEAVFVHPSSSLFEHPPPEWCIFSEVVRSRPKDLKAGEDEELGVTQLDEPQAQGRVFLKGLTRINPVWIPKLGKEMCTFSKAIPLDGEGQVGSLLSNIAALKDGSGGGVASQQKQKVVVTPVYGTGPACEPGERANMIGWDLPPMKATRRWVGGSKGWQVDI